MPKEPTRPYDVVLSGEKGSTVVRVELTSHDAIAINQVAQKLTAAASNDHMPTMSIHKVARDG